MTEKKKLKEKPDAPSKPKVKEETTDSTAVETQPKFRPGRDINMTLCRIEDANFATIATSSTRLAKMGLHFNLAEGEEPEYVLTIAIPCNLEGEWANTKIERSSGEEAQALYNAFPRKVPFHMLPAGCDLDKAPERKRKKKSE